MHRTVIRFPEDVSLQLQGPSLSLSGKAGSLKLDLQKLDPTGLCGFKLLELPAAPSAQAPASSSAQPAASSSASAQTSKAGPSSSASSPLSSASSRPLLVVVSPHKERFDALCSEVQSAVRGVSQGYVQGLVIKGVGYRVEPVDDPAVLQRAPKPEDLKPGPGGAPAKPWFFEKTNTEKQTVTYPHPNPTAALRLKVGYSRTAVYVLPPGVKAFLVKPTQLYLYGLQQAEVHRVAMEIRSIRKPNPYTGNGIQLADEVIKLKQRAGTK